MLIAHTPDADDAFMFYGLLSGKISANFEIKHLVEDIETLNRGAFDAEFDVTALSVHAYAFLHSQYRILSAGASVGDGYGPVVVAGRGMDVEGKRIAVPGKYTTANLLLKLAVDDFQPVEMRFDEVIPAVKQGEIDAGLVIHEGQITYAQHGLVKILDLWDWWHAKTGLLLPLGVNAIKRDIPEAMQREFLAVMRESVRYALEHVEEALQYAMKYARGADKELVKKFALMYVNKYTYEMPEEVLKAHDELYRMAERAGLFARPPLDIL
ncbi:MAG: ABC transporter substrate-binding protein [Methanophagales archaeon]|nr:ABC transporter substrate-binding protein [Methanophagales archaeon]MCW3142024.1 ABC transporter substrate-binding protein [Methanophagales archaeon]